MIIPGQFLVEASLRSDLISSVCVAGSQLAQGVAVLPDDNGTLSDSRSVRAGTVVSSSKGLQINHCKEKIRMVN